MATTRTPYYARSAQAIRVIELLTSLMDGALRVPRFERGFLWKESRRLALFDSIYKGYPIGALLVWRVAGQTLSSCTVIGDLAVRGSPSVAGGTADDPAPVDYLLDGMQRMTTLYAALAPALLHHRDGDESPEPLPRAIDVDTGGANGTRSTSKAWVIAPSRKDWEVIFLPDSETFAAIPPELQLPPRCVPLSLILDTFRLSDFRRLSGIDTNRVIARRIDDLQARLRDYQVPVIPLLNTDLEGAIESFRRVNSHGTRMGEADLLRALSWRPDFDLSQRLEPVRRRIASEGWGSIDEDVLVNLCKLEVGLTPYSYAAETFGKKVRTDPSVFARVEEKAARAAVFLRDHCDVHGRHSLPYAFQFVLLAYALPARLDAPTLALARDWFWKTTWTGYFASQRKIAQALKNLREYLTGRPVPHLLDDDSVEAAGRFDFRRARDKALALLLARRSRQPEQARWLGQRGDKAAHPLVPDLRIRRLAAGNVVLASDEVELEALRRDLLGVAGPRDPALLDRHAIDAVAHGHLRAGDAPGFARARLDHLRDLERAEMARLGLRYIVVDLPDEQAADGPLFTSGGDEDERDE